ncbi:hypothetical protein AKJ49_01635 [candidate division MSBL1 archaeon SCGC-AAA382A03]|uniref:Saccharopine dehydrogenase n=1 Tax=candidate division MSBL1 archaeon SCGC-AAA382A03 TaxID=1698278 RepID=A0A133VEH0_9EURY|nr:hypothetical protein AKJ49_01635 [candidate division MSBL1 archaeon SCGC-AAA382A03]
MGKRGGVILKVVVLGAGGNTSPGANRYLAENSDVDELVLADIDTDAVEARAADLGDKVVAEYADVEDHELLVDLFSDADVVVNAAVFYYNMDVMDACLEAETSYVDLGGLFHTAKKQLQRDDEFKEAGITGIVGLGSAPGIVNVMAGYAADQLDTVDSIEIRDGIVNYTDLGVPFQASYALDTLIDEFTQNAMVLEDGEFKEVEPFSGGEDVDYPEPVGTQTSYYTLHTEVYTLSKTYEDKGVQKVNFKLALPEDFERKLRFLVALGFGKKEPLEPGGKAPSEFLKDLVAELEQPDEDPEPDDHKVLRVDVEGKKDGKTLQHRLESVMHPMKKYGLSCGQLTVGGPAGIAAWMIGKGLVEGKGFMPPEKAIKPEPFFEELAKWDMQVYHSVKQPMP